MSLHGLLTQKPKASESDQSAKPELENFAKKQSDGGAELKNDPVRDLSGEKEASSISSANFKGFSTDTKLESPVVQVNGMAIDGVDAQDVLLLKPVMTSGPADPPLAPLPNQLETGTFENAAVRPKIPLPVSEYIVQKGDTIELIQNRYKMSETVRRYFLVINGLNSGQIKDLVPGSVLLIP